jgi:hypothetical protein
MYLVIAASLILSVIILKVCTITGNRTEQRLSHLVSSTSCNIHKPRICPNKGMNISEMRNKIEMHKAEIRKLEELAKQVEESEKQLKQEKRRQE